MPDYCPYCWSSLLGLLVPLRDPCFVDSEHRVGGIRLSQTEWTILRLLRERYQRLVPLDFLAQHSASDPATGGSVVSTRIRIMLIRRALRPTPYAIACQYRQGYGLFPAARVASKIRRGGKAHTDFRLSD